MTNESGTDELRLGLGVEMCGTDELKYECGRAELAVVVDMRMTRRQQSVGKLSKQSLGQMRWSVEQP